MTNTDSETLHNSAGHEAKPSPWISLVDIKKTTSSLSAAKEPLDFWSLHGTRKTVQNNQALWPKLFPFVRHVFDRRTETGFYCSETSFCIMNHFRESSSLI